MRIITSDIFDRWMRGAGLVALVALVWAVVVPEGIFWTAVLAAGLMLPPKGAILLSIADKDKPEAVPIIRGLASLDYGLFATEGTAALITSLGLGVTLITKKLDEGHPNVVDIIRDGTVNGVINTVTGDRTPLKDGFDIRRAAVEHHVPCYTSLDTARAVVEALGAGALSYSIKPLPEYLEGSRG